MTWTAPDVTYTRPPRTGTEREMLEGWLDAHRQVLLWKCRGLTAEQLKEQSNLPSVLTLLGLVRHLADCERWWFSRHAAQLPVPDLYCTDGDDNADFDGVPTADAAADLQTFERECEASRRATSALSLDDEVPGRHGHGSLSVRWIFVHMIEEYARHNGHADLLRERLDGVTGDFPPVGPTA